MGVVAKNGIGLGDEGILSEDFDNFGNFGLIVNWYSNNTLSLSKFFLYQINNVLLQVNHIHLSVLEVPSPFLVLFESLPLFLPVKMGQVVVHVAGSDGEGLEESLVGHGLESHVLVFDVEHVQLVVQGQVWVDVLGV